MQDIPGYLAIAVTIALVIYSIILHEISHGWVALQLGDPTAKNEGRLTLNPIAHIDVWNTILLPMMLYVMAGIILGGAKPVPINTYNFRNRRKGMMLTAAAGPATNFTIALAFILLMKLTFLVRPGSINEHVLAMVVICNILLGMFNLVPIPPLDGSRVVAWLAPKEIARMLDRIERFGIMILLIVFFFTPLRYYFFYGFAIVLETIGELFGVPLAGHLFGKR